MLKFVFVLTAFNGKVGGAQPITVPFGALSEKLDGPAEEVTLIVWTAVQPKASTTEIVFKPGVNPLAENVVAVELVLTGGGDQLTV